MTITINQIKGALSGAVIGEVLAQCQEQYFESDMTQISPCLSIALTGIKSIVNCYDIDQKSWLIHLANAHPDYLKYKANLSITETAIALIPVIIYLHENPAQLEENLNQAIKLWLKPELNSTPLKLWSLVVSQIFQEKSTINQDKFNLSKLTNKKKIVDVAELELIAKYIKNKLTLTKVSTHLQQQLKSDSVAIYLAIYCFYSLPDDFHLSIHRSTKVNYQTILTSTLTGFVLGLNNGYFAIPFNYRYHLESTLIYQEINQRSANLVKTWRGEYVIN